MRFWLRGSILIALVAIATVAGRAQSLMQDLNTYYNDVNGYNLIAFGNVTLQNGPADIQGGIAVGGTLTVSTSNWQVGSQNTPGSDPSLYVAGGLSLSSGVTLSVTNGYASLPGLSTSQWTWNYVSGNNSTKTLTKGTETVSEVNSSSSQSTLNPINRTTNPSWNFSTLQTTYENLSTSLGDATANGTIAVNGAQTLVFTPPASPPGDVAVFTLDASKLSGGDYYNGSYFTGIELNVPAGVNYVINVINVSSNQTLFGSNISFTGSSTYDDQVLWNFEGCSYSFTVTDGSYFYGSILAPEANPIDDNSTIDGNVVTDGFIDNGVELHDDDSFVPVQILVPEASTYGWWALGLCGLGIAVRRRHSRQRA
jgi:choice-of-anchor A domain-containing protein